MISAPIVPRTRQSLWDLLEGEPERIERGFALVQRELVVGDGAVVEGLGRDTSGRLVLVYLCAEDDDQQEVAQRVFAVDQWVRRNDRLLLNVLADGGVRSISPARVVVLGFEFQEATIEALKAIRLDDLSIMRCEAFVLDGNLHAGMSPVLGRDAEREYDTMTLPLGVADQELRRVGEEILDLLQRLDPNISVEGDRYSRRFSSARGWLADLFLDGERLYFIGAGEEEPTIVTGSGAREIRSSIVRIYRDQLTRPSSREARDQALRAALADHDESEELPSRDRLRIDHALHPLPRTPLVGDTEVSQEEFDAFGGASSETKES